MFHSYVSLPEGRGDDQVYLPLHRASTAGLHISDDSQALMALL